MGYLIYDEIDRFTGESTIRFAEAGSFGDPKGDTQLIFGWLEVDCGRKDQIHFFTDEELNSSFEHKRVLHKLLGPLNYNEIIELYYGERTRQTIG